MTELENLEVGEENETTADVETPEMDTSHTDDESSDNAREARYKEQLKGSRDEAMRLRNLVIEREMKAASKDARSLLELHETDPKLADEVAKKFGYDDFADAKTFIDEKFRNDDEPKMEKTSSKDFEENFEKFYQERRAKEVHEEALKQAEKILNKIKDEQAREIAQKQFDKIAGGKKLTIADAQEFAELATLFVNKDSLKTSKYEDGLASYASTGLGTGKKASKGDEKIAVVRGGKLVYLDDNNS